MAECYYLPIMGMGKKNSDPMERRLPKQQLRYLAKDRWSPFCRICIFFVSAWNLTKAETKLQVETKHGDLFFVWKESKESSRKNSFTTMTETEHLPIPRDKESLYHELTTFFGMSKAAT